MRVTRRWAAIVFCAALAACAPSKPGPVFRAGNLKITDVRARATVGASDTTAVYLSIANDGGENDRLVKVSTPLATAELHSMTMSGGLMRMREMDALDVAAGKRVKLTPGGNHIMVIGLKSPLKNGDELPLTLSFEHAGDVAVEARVGD